MTEDEFWALLADTAPGGSDVRRRETDYEEWSQRLIDRLVAGGLEESIEFHRYFDAARSALDTWAMWAVAWRIRGECDDDAYFAFLAWIVAIGRDTWIAAVEDPDALADVPAVRAFALDLKRHRDGDDASPIGSIETFGFELLGYAAPRAFEQLTGDADGLYDELDARGYDVAFGPEPGGPDVDPKSVAKVARRIGILFPMV